MKVDGKEFIRNVGIEQDKDRLVQEQHKLEELKRASIQRDQNYTDTDNGSAKDESAFVDLSVDSQTPPSMNNTNPNNVEDILLDTTNIENNKKKYIMLGLGLVLLFIITILVIRLISNNDIENTLENVDTEKNEIINDEILNKIDSNEAYQKVIDKKVALDKSMEMEEKKKKVINEIVVPEQEVNNVPLVLDTPKPKEAPKRDLFGLDKEKSSKVVAPVKKVVEKKVKVIEKAKVVKKVTPLSQPKRSIIVPPAKETNFTKKATFTKGYFVQIGAFTREPSRTLLKNIISKGYLYQVYKLTVKGKLYNKVLIGPYKTRTDAIRKLSQIKTDFKNPNAYILKL